MPGPRIPIARPAIGGRTGAPSRILSNPVKGSFDDPAGPVVGVDVGNGRTATSLGAGALKPAGPMSRGGFSRSTIRRMVKPPGL